MEFMVSEDYDHDEINLYTMARYLEIWTYEYESKGIAVALISSCSCVENSWLLFGSYNGKITVDCLVISYFLNWNDQHLFLDIFYAIGTLQLVA